jgi:hypothetical protein
VPRIRSRHNSELATLRHFGRENRDVGLWPALSRRCIGGWRCPFLGAKQTSLVAGQCRLVDSYLTFHLVQVVVESVADLTQLPGGSLLLLCHDLAPQAF